MYISNELSQNSWNTFHIKSMTTPAANPNNSNNIERITATTNNYSFFCQQPVGAFINDHKCKGQILLPLSLS